MHKKDLELTYNKFKQDIENLEKFIVEKEKNFDKLQEASTSLIKETEEFK